MRQLGLVHYHSRGASWLFAMCKGGALWGGCDLQPWNEWQIFKRLLSTHADTESAAHSTRCNVRDAEGRALLPHMHTLSLFWSINVQGSRERQGSLDDGGPLLDRARFREMGQVCNSARHPMHSRQQLLFAAAGAADRKGFANGFLQVCMEKFRFRPGDSISQPIRTSTRRLLKCFPLSVTYADRDLWRQTGFQILHQNIFVWIFVMPWIL